MKNKDTSDKPNPLVLIAFFCAMASVGIVALAFCLNGPISGLGMWGVAAMAACPSAMGVGIAYFMTREVSRPA